MLLAGIIYLLMSMRVQARLYAYVCGRHTRVYAEIAYLGLCVRIGGLPEKEKKKPGVEREKDWRQKLKKLRRNAKCFQRFLRLERGGVYLRLGLENAAQTAGAAGLCSAVMHAAAALPQCRGRCAVQVEPDYKRAGIVLAAQGIFSAPMGNIVFAAIDTALRNGRNRIKRRSGVNSGWKSIPLRA